MVAVAGAFAFWAYSALSAKDETAQWANWSQQLVDESAPLHTVTDIVRTLTEESDRLGQVQRDVAIAVAEQATPAVQQNIAELQRWDYKANVASAQVKLLTQEHVRLDRELRTVSGHLAAIASTYRMSSRQAVYLAQAAGLTGTQLEARGKAWQDALQQLKTTAFRYQSAGNGRWAPTLAGQ